MKRSTSTILKVFKLAMVFCIPIATILYISSCNQPLPESELPEVHIKYYADELNLGDYSRAEFKYINSNNDVEIDELIKIKYRGNASSVYDKKNFSLKFEERVSLGNLDSNRRWKLNAEYIDKTLMRNKLSYDLFRSFSPNNYAPEVRYCLVYENGDYHGIYTITESTDETSLGLRAKHPEAVLFKEPPISYPPSEHELRLKNFKNYSRISIRYDAFSDKARRKLIRESYFNQRFPDMQEKDQTDAIKAVTMFIFESSDEEFGTKEQFEKYFDIENILDWHLLILVTGNGDGFMKNFYLHRKKDGEPFLYSPWDFDHSFGREGDGEPSREKIVDLTKMPLFKRLLETNAFNYRENLYAKYLMLKQKGILSADHIIEMMDENAKTIRKEIKNHEHRWPIQNPKFSNSLYFKNADFESELLLMKDWISNHLKRLDNFFPKMLEEYETKKQNKDSSHIFIPDPIGAQPIGSAVDPTAL